MSVQVGYTKVEMVWTSDLRDAPIVGEGQNYLCPHRMIVKRNEASGHFDVILEGVRCRKDGSPHGRGGWASMSFPRRPWIDPSLADCPAWARRIAESLLGETLMDENGADGE